MLKKAAPFLRILPNRLSFIMSKRSPLRPPPSPSSALKAVLSEVETTESPKPCFQFTGTPKKDNACYETPFKDNPVKRRYDNSIYEPTQTDLGVHEKADLDSSVCLEEGELKDENSCEPTDKNCPGATLKRSHSSSDLEELTLKKTKSGSPQRASLPALTTAQSPLSRRKSLPFTLVQSRRADQTPYSSPWQRPRPSRFTYDSSRLQDPPSGFVDTHCHLDFLFDRCGFQGTFAQFKEERHFPKGFEGCLAVFCNPHSFDMKWKWGPFLEEEGVWASFGCHPHNAQDYDDRVERSLVAALQHPRVRALGEIGLDYSNRNSCQKDKQFEAFRRQLRIALQKKLPVVIHCREAHDDGMRLTREILPKDHPIHLHCFTDTWAVCQRWLLEFPSLCVGLTSVLSFPSAQGVRDVAEHIPLHRLLLETDAPYFVPRDSSIPRDTRHSHPGMAVHVAAQVAAIKRIPLEHVLVAARSNTRRIYGI